MAPYLLVPEQAHTRTEHTAAATVVVVVELVEVDVELTVVLVDVDGEVVEVVTPVGDEGPLQLDSADKRTHTDTLDERRLRSMEAQAEPRPPARRLFALTRFAGDARPQFRPCAGQTVSRHYLPRKEILLQG
jgi:hypothetical protein